jgi:phosphonate utilization associated putative membrane protein
MTLTWPIVSIVLCAALLHASWNAMIKSGGDKATDTALVTIAGALLALPFLLWTGWPKAVAWPYLLASALIHIGYYLALVEAYRHGDLGLTYPIMRGFAPLLVALGSSAFIGEAPSTTAWLGIAGITVGVALVGLAHPGEAFHHRKTLMFAFANAGLIAIYTTVDGIGVRTDGDAARYVLMLFLLDGFVYPALVWWRRRPTARAELIAYARRRWPVATLGAAASIGAYAIALWAMTQAPVASVAALRETSVLFAALLGSVLLKERFGLQRAIGTGVIVAGVMALRFA